MDRDAIVRRLADNQTRVLERMGLPESDLERRYAPDKWTVRMLLAHLADVEFINYWRLCRALAEPGSSVEPFDQDRWERELDYAHRSAAVLRGLFAGPRAAAIELARTLPEATLRNACLHPEKGRMSGEDWLLLSLSHSEHHLGQIDAAVAGRPWSPNLPPDAWRFGAAPKPT